MYQTLRTVATVAAFTASSQAFASDILVNGSKYDLSSLGFSYSRVCFDGGKNEFRYRQGFAKVNVRTFGEPKRELKFVIYDKDAAELLPRMRSRYDEKEGRFVSLSEGLPPLSIRSREQPTWTAISLDDVAKEPYARAIKRDGGMVISCEDQVKMDGDDRNGLTTSWYNVEEVVAALKK